MSGKQQGSEEDVFIGPQAKKVKPQSVMKRPQPRIPFWKQNVDEPPAEKQVSEADLQLKSMVEKQLDTKITLESEIANKKEFHQASMLIDEQERRAGAHSLESFKKHSIMEKQLPMQNCGMTGGKIDTKSAKRMAGSDASEAMLRRKEGCKVNQHSNQFSSTKEMTRHEMEIEQSLYRGTKKAEEFKHLIKSKKQEFPENDPVMKTLKEYEEREERKKKNAKKATKLNRPKNDDDESDDDEDDGDGRNLIGPVLAPLYVRVKPLDEKEVNRNRLTIDEIKSIKKFANYEPGAPSKKLYVKNLPKNVTEEDLASLFVRFESLESPCMEYRVLDGRMRGQAFITFKDKDTASQALAFGNGYIMNGKPIIIAFGRDGKSR